MDKPFKSNDSVYHIKKGTVWVVRHYDAKTKRYQLMRVTPDRTFHISSASHLITTVPKVIPVQSKKVSNKKVERKSKARLTTVEHPSMMLNEFEKAITVLMCVYSHPKIKVSDIHRDYFQDYSLRTIQRVVLSLHEAGYLIRNMVSYKTGTYSIAQQHEKWVCLLTNTKELRVDSNAIQA